MVATAPLHLPSMFWVDVAEERQKHVARPFNERHMNIYPCFGTKNIYLETLCPEICNEIHNLIMQYRLKISDQVRRVRSGRVGLGSQCHELNPSYLNVLVTLPIGLDQSRSYPGTPAPFRAFPAPLCASHVPSFLWDPCPSLVVPIVILMTHSRHPRTACTRLPLAPSCAKHANCPEAVTW